MKEFNMLYSAIIVYILLIIGMGLTIWEFRAHILKSKKKKPKAKVRSRGQV
jgi:positive regulator of sigma E activity